MVFVLSLKVPNHKHINIDYIINMNIGVTFLSGSEHMMMSKNNATQLVEEATRTIV